MLLTPLGTGAGSGQVQAALTEAMSMRQGCALAIDAQSGKLLAHNRVETAAKRVVPPGSVIKPFTLAALIEKEIVRASTREKCGRTLRLGGRRLDCAHVDVGEAFDPVNALAYSCNSYFARFAARLNPTDLVRVLTSFGLNASTSFVKSEVVGTITSPRDVVQLQLLALGEAGIFVTPLEVAAAYRQLALLKHVKSSRTEQLSVVFDGLSAATDYGTARLARPSSVAIAGKTGTATEQSGIRAHAWFAGYAPADYPEIVVVVFLETGSGGGDAAPVARQIFAAL